MACRRSLGMLIYNNKKEGRLNYVSRYVCINCDRR